MLALYRSLPEPLAQALATSDDWQFDAFRVRRRRWWWWWWCWRLLGRVAARCWPDRRLLLLRRASSAAPPERRLSPPPPPAPRPARTPQLDQLSQGRPLSLLAFHLMVATGLVARLQLDEERLVRYLMRIEDGYPNNPYHNK